jgi:hypothetical protein
MNSSVRWHQRNKDTPEYKAARRKAMEKHLAKPGVLEARRVYFRELMRARRAKAKEQE